MIDLVYINEFLVGLVAGWAVLIFSETYYEVRNELIKIIPPKAKLSIWLLKVILPAVFLDILLLVAMAVFLFF